MCGGTRPERTLGLLLVRLAKPGREALLERVSSLFANEPITEWRGCLVITTDHKVRVKRPM